ncbi:hypothetical protein CGRA01v4_00456 [Colletotrichum graminicola]|nr:hypothetical protein CGRA01v4_00456 [Colletotrichum graminicola]
MFNAERQRLLDSCRWSPGEGQLGYFEVWADDCAAGSVADSFRTGFLDDDEVEQWLHQQRRFSRRAMFGEAESTMRIRLLMCERVGWLPLGFAMSRSSFLAMQTAFRLSTEMLPALDANNGEKYSNLRFGAHNKNRPEFIALTAKLPQMSQLGNLGLAMSHHLETDTTVAFLHGWNMFCDRDYVTKEPIIPHAKSLHETMQSATTTLWAHPLFLPIVLMREHLSRAETFKRQLGANMTDIEKVLGVTNAARLMRSGVDAFAKRMVQDEEKRLQITARLLTTAKNVVNILGVLEWDLQYAKFLGRVSGELGAIHGQMSPAADAELRSIVDYLRCEALSLVSFVGAMKSKLDLQLTVLYNYIAQAENNLDRRNAANAGLDSTAMKTLAVVTMVFLPPPPGSTIFSMSMFGWQGASSTAGDTKRTVVPELWIYWAVSIPLTLVIVIGWRVWWHFQKSYYENKYSSVKTERNV